MQVNYDYETNLITVVSHRLDGITKKTGWVSRNHPTIAERFVSRGELITSCILPRLT